MAHDIELTSDQKNVLGKVLNWIKDAPTPYLTIGGYAGTGKTTLIAYLRKYAQQHLKDEVKRVAFCSFTGKAASVLRQKLKEAGAIFPEDSCGTIHSLIYKAVTDDAGQIITWDRVSTMAADLIVIDEGSMVNERIWHDLLSYGTPILVFGDHGQLPPTEGSFNLMQQPALTLESIVRQAEGSPIIRLSRAVREGRPVPYGTFGNVKKYPMQADDAHEVFESAVAGRDDYLCICGTNKTRVSLNRRIRAMKGHEDDTPRKGDRVICLKNNYAKMIFNGMLGTIKRIHEDPDHWYDVAIALEDGLGDYRGNILRHQFLAPKTLRGEAARTLAEELPEREFGDLFDFGYALTTHKAQGSEANRVILFEERMFGYDDDMWRRWLYTAVTRAREELLIFA